MFFAPELVPIADEYEYNKDTLQSIGWNVINPLPVPHTPHLSYRYFKKDYPPIPACVHYFPHSLSDWDLCVVDTKDEDYSKWKIIDI
jgi:hypothetical protein